MEVQLQELIDQIKKDGVAVAEAEAKSIVDTAKAEADKLVADARAQAQQILASAKAETERMTRSGEDAIRQAGRNLLISFRESVTRELNAVVNENVAAVYNSKALAELIIHVVNNWTVQPEAEDLTVILNSQDLEKLEETVVSALKQTLSREITLKANDNFDGGFRIAVNNGSAYYDFSADAVVQMLSNYLSPKVAQLLKEAK